MVRNFFNIMLVWLLFIPGIPPLKTAAASIDYVYLDDFESIRNDRELQQSYTVWQDGADIQASLSTVVFHSGKKAMRVAMQGINPVTQAVNGSIYHTLNSWQNNWTGGKGLRFWLQNYSDDPLMLNFNFKEKYNEYWSIAQVGIFYLEDAQGNLTQQDIYYSNLLIPARYEGVVIVPFSSFAVPEWNTAVGDYTMQLKNIESYALGMSLGDHLPQVFYVDDIEIITRDDYPVLFLSGEEWVNAPTSGELALDYTAQVQMPGSDVLTNISADWSVAGVLPSGVTFSPDGRLTVSAGVESQTLILTAAYSSEKYHLSNSKTIHIMGSESQTVATVEPTPTLYATPIPTQYQQFSNDFEKWTTENRALFVVLLVGAVVVLIAILSALQRRLK